MGEPLERQLLQKMEEQAERQERYMRQQLFWTKFGVALLAVLTITVVFTCSVLVPRVDAVLTRTDHLLETLEPVTNDLAEADLSSLVESAELFIKEGPALTNTLNGAGNALESIQSVDFEALNKAIEDLQAIVAPLARLFR